MNDEEILHDMYQDVINTYGYFTNDQKVVALKAMQKARADERESFAQWLEASRNWLSFEDRGQEAITKKINQLRALASGDKKE